MAVPPYNDNRNLPSAGTAQLRPGRVTDRSRTGGSAPTGVPSQPIVQYTLNSPAAVVTNRFLTSTATTTAAKTYTLTETSMPDTYVGSGGDSLVTFYVARNVICTLSGSATAEVIVSGVDFQGQAQTETFTWTAETGVKNGVKTFAYLTGATSTSDTDRNLTIGFGNVFGLPYPMYSDQGIRGALYDADGADYANTQMTTGGIVPGGTTAVSNAIPLAGLRVWDAFATNLPGTALADDLGLVTLATTVGTDWDVALQTADMDNNDAVVSYYAAFLYVLPPTYVSGGAVTITANAGMITTVADVSCTLDFEVFESGLTRNPATDLCATAAQSMNSLTAANLSFTVTPTNLVAGDTLLIRMTVAGRDNTATGVTIGRVNRVLVTSLQSSAASVATTPLYAFTPGDPTSTTADRYGTVLLGTTNTSSGTLVPDGTIDYAIWYVCNDTEGVLNSGGTGPIYDIT